MNKTTTLLTLFTIILLITPLTSAETTPFPRTQPAIIYVDDNNTQGPWDGTLEHPYQHIQQALNNASPNDIIYVFSGLYKEHITITIPITLQGENQTTTIIDGNYIPTIITIQASNTHIQDFTIRNTSGLLDSSGINIQANNTHITNCTFYRTQTGILINRSHTTSISHCIFYTNGKGIIIYYAYNNNITSCYFYHNALGMQIENAHNNTIHDSYADTNGIGYFVNHSSHITFQLCAAYNNNDNQNGISLYFSTHITIDNCNIHHNGFGVKLINSSTIIIQHSTFIQNTHAALHLDRHTTETIIQANTMTFQPRFAVYIKDSSCMLHNNNLYDNLFGLYAETSNADFRHNWWGSPFGPALFERIQKDRFFPLKSRFQFIPWAPTHITAAGASWIVDEHRFTVDLTTSSYQHIILPGLDTDEDMVPDWWETKWGYEPDTWDDHQHLDPDNDGLNNIEECYTDTYNSNPFHRDIFLEFDWMPSQYASTNKPSQEILDDIQSLFADHNISLHIDTGMLNGSEEIPYMTNFTYATLVDLYWTYFLHNDINNPRKGIFHYGIICDYGTDRGFAFCGWDSLDSFLISAQYLVDNQPTFARELLIVGGAIHELGHTLGLNVDDHGGIDNMVVVLSFTIQSFLFRNYKSCMNYRYTYHILGYSDGSHGFGDFNDWENIDFSFFKKTHFIPPE